MYTGPRHVQAHGYVYRGVLPSIDSLCLLRCPYVGCACVRGRRAKAVFYTCFFCGVRIFKKNRNTKFATNLALRSLVDSKRPQVILRNQAYLNHEAGAPQSQTKRFLKVLRSQTKCSSRKLSLPVANLRYREGRGEAGGYVASE